MKDYYDIRYTSDPGRRKVWKAIVEDLQKFVKEKDAVLDLGSGYADFINNIKCADKYAVDYNENSRKYCYAEVKFIKTASIDLSAIPSQSINVVFCSNLLEHLNRNELATTIKEIARILRPRGTLILLQPNYKYCYRDYFDDFTHITVFTHINLADWLLANHFIPLKVIPQYLPLTMKSLFPKSYWLTKLYLWVPLKPMGKQMLLVFKKE